MMTKDEFYDFLITEKGQDVDEFIINANTELQKQFFPLFFHNGEDQIVASDFIYYLLCDLVANALNICLESGHLFEQKGT